MNEYQPSFFDEAECLDKLNKLGDPLVRLSNYMDSQRGQSEIC
jgi:hypothetical protein